MKQIIRLLPSELIGRQLGHTHLVVHTFMSSLILSLHTHTHTHTRTHTHTHTHTCAEKRQTVLFSATQTRNVEDLARVSLKKAPLYVGVDDDKQTSTVEGLEQVRNGAAYMQHIL